MGVIFETIILDICLIPAALAIAIIFHYMDAFSYWKRKKVPYISPSFPWGSVALLAEGKQNFGECFAQMYTTARVMKERFMGFYILTKPLLVLADPNLIKTMLVQDCNFFPGRGFYYDEENDPLSAHGCDFSGEKWSKIRKKITPLFTSGKMKTMFYTLLKCSDEIENIIQESIDKSEAIDTRDIFEKLTINNIGSCVFGLNCNTFKNADSEFQKYGTMLFNSNMSHASKLLLAIRFSWVVKLLRISAIQKEISEFFMNLLRQTMDKRERSNEKRKDFIDLIIRLKNNQNIDDASMESIVDDEETFTFNELVAQAFVFFAAGFETSATTINYALFELAQHQKIQNRVRDEILSVLSKYDSQISYDAVQEMTYLEQIINETLRKYPPIPILNRECVKSYSVPESDVIIEPGTRIWVPILGIHRDPEYYPHPEIFNPERFTKEEGSKRKPYTYLPFGDEPSTCIGLRFGNLQVKVALIKLLQGYKYAVDPQTELPMKFNTKGVFLAPRKKIFLRAQRLQ